ncbi:cytochrome P450 [Nocardia sp. NBC_00881]|uniref:cytochrome P450 n=1 Tax=Nocardia sp. NBC_00881 TaxID=2975995 RepID=UPI0038706F79|nr:cytochrome P450 [Nocardia sp. NBC_00881]
MKPSDFLRDSRFRDPGPAFIEDGTAHLRSHKDIWRAMMDTTGAEFTQDASYWLPPEQPWHITWSFVWAAGVRRADGSPGRHRVLRDLVEPWFRHRAVQTLTGEVGNLTGQLLRAIVDKGTGTVDLATELAYPLAMRTTCALVGLPATLEPWLADYIDQYQRTPGLDQVAPEPPEVRAYFWDVVKQREAAPKDDLIDVIIAAWRRDEITDDEVLGYLWGFFAAGKDTTGTHIANLFALLSEFDLLGEARSRLDDDEWIRTAGEEVLRFCPPFPVGPALTVSDVELGDGVTLPARTPVSLWFSAANRDPAVSGENADTFDVTRSTNRHLAFGSGLHRCFGAPLARMEANVAFRATLRALPGLEPDPDGEFQRYAGIVDGVNAAPFQFDQRAAESLVAD